jgi:hypothetical protein
LATPLRNGDRERTRQNAALSCVATRSTPGAPGHTPARGQKEQWTDGNPLSLRQRSASSSSGAHFGNPPSSSNGKNNSSSSSEDGRNRRPTATRRPSDSAAPRVPPGPFWQPHFVTGDWNRTRQNTALSCAATRAFQTPPQRSRGIGDRLPEERSREGDQDQPETQNEWKEQGLLPDTSRRGCRAAVTWEALRLPLSKEASDGGGGSHTSLEPPKKERQQTPKAQE